MYEVMLETILFQSTFRFNDSYDSQRTFCTT